MAGFARLGPASLLARTNLTLAVSSLVIVAISIAALQEFVVNPIVEQSADDEAALLVLTAQTWTRDQIRRTSHHIGWLAMATL